MSTEVPPIVATLFSDPMMGLAYECEPTLDGLAAHYGTEFELRHAMVVLVRDVADYMTPTERALPSAQGIERYNARLARIYLDEEPLGGLPMNMEGFCLFDESHRTSEPLCLAFEAARIASPECAEAYLRAVRRATIVDARQTTRRDVLADIAAKTGVDVASFNRALADGSARDVLRRDQELAAAMGVRGLPSMLLQVRRKAMLVSPLAGYEYLLRVIDDLATVGT